MSDYRNALIKIMEVCGQAATYNRRTQHINDIAMRALGMTSGQRIAVHSEIIGRVGEVDQLASYQARIARRDAKMLEAHGEGCEPSTY